MHLKLFGDIQNIEGFLWHSKRCSWRSQSCKMHPQNVNHMMSILIMNVC